MGIGLMQRAPGRAYGLFFLLALSGPFLGGSGVDAMAQNEPPSAYDFHGQAEIQSMGLSFPTFAGAVLRGLPSPRVSLVTTDEGITKDAYCIRDVWFRRQWLAQWSVATGEFMLLAEARTLLPEQAMGKLVTDAAYQELEQKFGVAVTNDVRVAQWMEAFGRLAVKGPPETLAATMQLESVQRYTLDSESHPCVAYILRFRPNAYGVDHRRSFMLLVRGAGGGSAKDLAGAMERDVIPHFKLSPGKGRSTSSAQASAGGALEASRQAALRSIEGRKDWWSASSARYIVVTDIKPTRRKWVEDILADIESLRTVFEKLLPPTHPIESVGVIRIFSGDDEYVKYVGKENGWSGGLWHPQKRELVIRPKENATSREQREWLFGVVYHESMHQYVFYAFPGDDVPVWFHEAHATFIEGAEGGRMGWTIGETERYRGRIDAMVKSGAVDFGPLLQMDDEAFYGGGGDVRSQHYALAWALAYYLHKAGPSDRTSPGAGLMKKLLNEAKENGISGAQERIFDAATVQAINADFIKFWKTPGRRPAARKYDPTRGG